MLCPPRLDAADGRESKQDRATDVLIASSADVRRTSHNADYLAARAGPMSDCLATVPWPPAIVAPVMPYFLRISPTAAVPSERSIGPRGEMRSVTYRMLPVTTWTRRKPCTWGLGIL